MSKPVQDLVLPVKLDKPKLTIENESETGFALTFKLTTRGDEGEELHHTLRGLTGRDLSLRLSQVVRQVDWVEAFGQPPVSPVYALVLTRKGTEIQRHEGVEALDANDLGVILNDMLMEMDRDRIVCAAAERGGPEGCEMGEDQSDIQVEDPPPEESEPFPVGSKVLTADGVGTVLYVYRGEDVCNARIFELYDAAKAGGEPIAHPAGECAQCSGIAVAGSGKTVEVYVVGVPWGKEGETPPPEYVPEQLWTRDGLVGVEEVEPESRYFVMRPDDPEDWRTLEPANVIPNESGVFESYLEEEIPTPEKASAKIVFRLVVVTNDRTSELRYFHAFSIGMGGKDAFGSSFAPTINMRDHTPTLPDAIRTVVGNITRLVQVKKAGTTTEIGDQRCQMILDALNEWQTRRLEELEGPDPDFSMSQDGAETYNAKDHDPECCAGPLVCRGECRGFTTEPETDPETDSEAEGGDPEES